MKRYFNILVGCLLIFSMNSCLYHNLEDLENSSDKNDECRLFISFLI